MRGFFSLKGLKGIKGKTYFQSLAPFKLFKPFILVVCYFNFISFGGVYAGTTLLTGLVLFRNAKMAFRSSSLSWP